MLCNKWGKLTYNSIIRTYRPNFATSHETLRYNLVTEGYQLPLDYEMIVSSSAAEYVITETTIHADGATDELKLEYISNDISKLHYASDSFGEALALSIAAKLAFPITKEALIANALNKRAQEALHAQAYSDNQERRPSRFTKGLTSMSSWTNRR